MSEPSKTKRGLVRPLTSSRTLSRVAFMAAAFAAYGAVPLLPWFATFRDGAFIPAEIHAP